VQLRHWLALLGAPTVGRPEDMLAAHIGAAEALVAREALIAKARPGEVVGSLRAGEK
jgi:hypothetical protein